MRKPEKDCPGYNGITCGGVEAPPYVKKLLRRVLHQFCAGKNSGEAGKALFPELNM